MSNSALDASVSGSVSASVSASVCHQVYKTGRYQALRRGLTGDRTDECALGFLIYMHRDNGRVLRSAPRGEWFGLWLHTCARNYAYGFGRAISRIRQHERPWPDLSGWEESDRPYNHSTFPQMLEARLLWQECEEKIGLALAQLTRDQRTLFIRYYLRDESICELATSYGRTPRAVHQALFRARKKLRALLEEQGLTESELRASCGLTAQSGPV